MPSDPTRSYASMGNYLFNAKVLVQALKEANERGEHDFGHHVLPKLKDTHRVFAYDFATNKVPGTKPYEEPAYWRDVGTRDAYFQCPSGSAGRDAALRHVQPAVADLFPVTIRGR